MSDAAQKTCPRCSAPADGAFCSQCGQALADPRCAACQAELSPGGRFCRVCGNAVSERPAAAMQPTPRSSRLPWLLAGLLTVIAITAVVYAAGARRGPAATGNPSAAGTPPDLSTMSPKEQFERLNDRVTRAAEQGDSATAITFWPMAAGAYDNLPPADRDVDARFHMAWLHYLVGEYPATLALADTINSTSPGNLFGYYLRAAVAAAQGDSATARAQRAAFHDHFGAEIGKSGHPEYVDHRAMLDQYFQAP